MKFWLVLLPGVLTTILAGAQSPAGSPPQPPKPPALAQPPPVPPAVPLASVDLFCKLLDMSPAEREASLASRSPDQRAIIASKIREYLQLTPGQREERLHSWRMRVLVRHLIRMPASNRVDQLASLSPADRQLVEGRMKEWDQMPKELRQAVLENEWAIRILVQSDGLAPVPPVPGGTGSGPEEQLARWQALPATQRQEILEQFQRYVEELSDKQKARIAATWPTGEREQVEQTVQAFSRLPKPQRDLCLVNLQKFTALSPAERQQFLRNANWWDGMTPQERDIWRKLVNRISHVPPPAPR